MISSYIYKTRKVYILCWLSYVIKQLVLLTNILVVSGGVARGQNRV